MSATPTKIKLPEDCESAEKKGPSAPPTPSQAKRTSDAAILTSPKRSPLPEPADRSPPKSPKVTSESLKKVSSPKPFSL
jgi:hypothetical protein